MTAQTVRIVCLNGNVGVRLKDDMDKLEVYVIDGNKYVDFYHTTLLKVSPYYYMEV